MPRPGEKSRRFPVLPGSLPIKRIEAAVSQLETAIWLWFHNGDPASICTLTFAAAELITRLNITFKGKPGIMAGETIDPKFRKRVLAHVKDSPNKLKHGDKDPNEIIHVPMHGIEQILTASAATYMMWGQARRPIIEVFINWKFLSEPKHFRDIPERFKLDPAKVAHTLKVGKTKFFEDSMPMQIRVIAGLPPIPTDPLP